MASTLTTGSITEQEKEIVGILIDSSLYLDMDLKERCGLLHFIVASYFYPSAK